LSRVGGSRDSRRFNSLPAQRRAVRAFIRSGKSRGWVCLPETYEDVGQSGRALNRPALRRLLADIAAGKVDCVVAYSVDRRTRQSADQTRLVARLRRHQVTVVIVCPVTFHAMGGKTIDAVPAAEPPSARLKRRGTIGQMIGRRSGEKDAK